MSSSSVLRFIKDISAKNLAAVQQRLKAGERAQQSYCDPARQSSTYSLLHRAVLVGSCEIAAVLLSKGADCNARDSCGRTPLHWLAAAAARSGGGGAEPAACAKLAGEGCSRRGGCSGMACGCSTAAPDPALLLLLLLMLRDGRAAAEAERH